MLFACGCAMLVHRAVFVDAGRWDEGTFAYYEDVELGWRLNLLGHTVWFSPRSVVHHKHHGTSGRWPEPPRTRLYERNSLRMIYELLERTSLERALAASLLLAADRALLSTPLSRATEVPAGARRLTPGRLTVAAKKALVARGITRKTPVAKALLRLGIRGWLEVAREVTGADTPATHGLPGRIRRRPAWLERRAVRIAVDRGSRDFVRHLRFSVGHPRPDQAPAGCAAPAVRERRGDRETVRVALASAGARAVPTRAQRLAASSSRRRARRQFLRQLCSTSGHRMADFCLCCPIRIANQSAILDMRDP